MRSFLAGWRLSLQRTRADWPIVAAAWLVMLLAAVLLAAGPMYPAAASEAGLRRALADAPVEDASIDISVYGASIDATAIDGGVQAEVQGVIGPIGGSVVRDWRDAATFALDGLPGSEAGDRAVLGFIDGLPDHARLVGGAWPAERRGPSEPIEVVVVEAIANELRLTIDAEVRFGDQSSAVPARLVGVFAIKTANDPYWGGDAQLLSGIRANASYRTLGPFFTTQSGLVQQAGVAQVYLRWRVFPDFEQLTVDQTAALAGGLDALSERLGAVTGRDVYVATGLPAILRTAERSLLVSRTGVLLLMAQLSVLAAYALILTASLLVDHRRVETALLRSRGAAPRQVAFLGLAEGLALAIPAVLVAPWLAVGALNLLNVVGPLAEVGLAIGPRVSIEGYIAAGAAGLACVALLVLPAALSARSFAAEQGGISRQETRTFGQRMGLDIALLAVTGIALWQLRLYGAPLTRTVQGSLGLDPLLVAAPAIGLLAGGVLALRALPLLAEVAEAAVGRGRGLVLSLGARQLARRPLRYTRSALLLILAVSMGVFAVSYGATWSTSQRDQAAYQSGADVRVQPGRTSGGVPGWALPGALTRQPGVERASPVERMRDGVQFDAAGSADLLALDAETAASIVLIRADDSAAPLADMVAALRAGRPEPALATLPAGAAYLRIVPQLDFTSIGWYDSFNGSSITEYLDPAMVDGVSLNVSAIVRDAHGLMYFVETGLRSTRLPTSAIVLALEPIDARTAAAVAQVGGSLDGPVELVGLGLDISLPPGMAVTGGVVGLTEASAGVDPAGPWTDVPLAAAGWTAKMGAGLRLLRDVPADLMRGTAVELGSGDVPFDGIFGTYRASGPSTRLRILPTSVAGGLATVPVIANRALLAATGSAKGDTISATVEGASTGLLIVGVVDSFPTTDPARPLLLFDEPTLGLLRVAGMSGARFADEWWMATIPGGEDALGAALRGDPFRSVEVVTVVERIRSLGADPVALGIIGALSLGFVATGLFAIVGLSVSAAVSARQRRTEFALLRALGLSGRQLWGSLWLENGSLVLVSLLAGTGLGLLISWLVLPFATMTQQAAAPVPPVVVSVPWDRVLLLDVMSAAALGVAVVVIGAVLRRLGVGGVLRVGED